MHNRPIGGLGAWKASAFLPISILSYPSIKNVLILFCMFYLLISQDNKSLINEKEYLLFELETITKEHATEMSAVNAEHKKKIRQLKEAVEAHKADLDNLENERDDFMDLLTLMKKKSIPVEELPDQTPEAPTFQVTVESTLKKTVENLRAELEEALIMNIDLKVHSTIL